MSFRYQRRYVGPVQAVILDWAGTAVDFGCMAPPAAFVEAFRLSGVPITVAQARAPMGLPKREHIKAICEMPAVAEAWTARHGHRPGRAEVDALYTRFIPLQVEVAARHADLIPGLLETVSALHLRGVRIGSTSGYPREVMTAVAHAALHRGYRPDAIVCAGETATGRPGPAMALKTVLELSISPIEACVKVGDTVVDVEEGLNAGMWSVAVTLSGNEVGLSERELDALSASERERLRAAAEAKLAAAGAHYVIDTIADLFPVLDDIEARLKRGEKP